MIARSGSRFPATRRDNAGPVAPPAFCHFERAREKSLTRLMQLSGQGQILHSIQNDRRTGWDGAAVGCIRPGEISRVRARNDRKREGLPSWKDYPGRSIPSDVLKVAEANEHMVEMIGDRMTRSTYGSLEYSNIAAISPGSRYG